MLFLPSSQSGLVLCHPVWAVGVHVIGQSSYEVRYIASNKGNFGNRFAIPAFSDDPLIL